MRRETEYLRHILEEIVFVEGATDGLTQAAFLTDGVLKRAVVCSLEIVGEGAQWVPGVFRAEHAQVDWRAMAGMRDRLIHDYFGVDYGIVWDVVENHLPTLKEEVEKLL